MKPLGCCHQRPVKGAYVGSIVALTGEDAADVAPSLVRQLQAIHFDASIQGMGGRLSARCEHVLWVSPHYNDTQIPMLPPPLPLPQTLQTQFPLGVQVPPHPTKAPEFLGPSRKWNICPKHKPSECKPPTHTHEHRLKVGGVYAIAVMTA